MCDPEPRANCDTDSPRLLANAHGNRPHCDSSRGGASIVLATTRARPPPILVRHAQRTASSVIPDRRRWRQITWSTNSQPAGRKGKDPHGYNRTPTSAVIPPNTDLTTREWKSQRWIQSPLASAVSGFKETECEEIHRLRRPKMLVVGKRTTVVAVKPQCT